MNKAQQLLNYQDRINNLEQEQSREKGKQQIQSEALLKEFQCKSIREAEHEFERMGNELAEAEEEYEENLEELHQLFNPHQ